MSARGFTLVELLVALAIALLALLSLPPLFSKALPGTELKAAARDIAARLRAAREHAILANGEASFTLDLAQGRYRGDGERRVGRLPAGLDVVATVAGEERPAREAARIRFFPDGGSTGGRIRLSAGARTHEITVDWLTGRVRLDE